MTVIPKIQNANALHLRKPAFEDMPLYRIQLELTTGEGKDAGTDDPVYVLMNNADTRFFLVRGIDNFEEKHAVIYDVLSTKVRKVKDLQFLHFGVKGNDGVCFKRIKLYLNGMGTPVFSKEFSGRGSCFDNDDPHNVKQLIISGAELRSTPGWKVAMNSNDIWLPIQKIPKEMILSLVEGAIGNQLQQMDGSISWGDTSGFDTRFGDAVEVNFVDAKTLHFDLDLQANVTGPNPALDVDFDLEFNCVDGIIKFLVKNVKWGTNWIGDIQSTIRGKSPLLATALGTYFGLPSVASAFAGGMLATYLKYALNFLPEAPNLSQSCRLIRVTEDCDIILA